MPHTEGQQPVSTAVPSSSDVAREIVQAISDLVEPRGGVVNVESMTQRIADHLEARLQITALQWDKRLLDWLAENQIGVGYNVEVSAWGVDVEAPFKPTLRDAILEAMYPARDDAAPAPSPADSDWLASPEDKRGAAFWWLAFEYEPGEWKVVPVYIAGEWPNAWLHLPGEKAQLPGRVLKHRCYWKPLTLPAHPNAKAEPQGGGTTL